jgi:hypothetical protein
MTSGVYARRCKLCDGEIVRGVCANCGRSRHKENTRLSTKRWYKRSNGKEKGLNRSRQRRFGAEIGVIISQLIEQQNNKCGICFLAFDSDNSACIDHNHYTNELRGLLCQSCNKALGFFKDNIVTLRSALKYMESYE